jgi:hypothetical protein
MSSSMSEIRITHGKRHINNIFGWSIFTLVNNAKIGKTYVNVTPHGTLRIFKFINEYSNETIYQVSYFKHNVFKRIYLQLKG